QALVLVDAALVVGDATRARVEPDGAPAEVVLYARVAALAPDAVLRLPLPQALAERRAGVRRVPLGARQGDAPGRVVLSDAGRGRIAGHAGADDQIAVVGHLGPP